jgi:adenosylcobinamide-phosphate synthase
MDARLNLGPSRKLKGVLVAFTLAVGAWWIGGVISWLGWLPTLLVAAILLAQRSLVDHVKDVASALRVSVEDGRISVAKIVGRETQSLDQSGVSRAAIESAAENLSDGVIAPAFWFLIGGLPGLLIYKAINTADSMIGYKTETYKDFGWASARLDDVLNWIPARVTAVLIATTHSGLMLWKDIRADASLHRSPNAGWPESAMARALDIALSGPRTYDNKPVDYPFVHDFGRKYLSANDIDAAVSALWRAWGLMLVIIFLLALL